MAAAAAARERHGAAIGWVSVGQGAASCRSFIILCGRLPMRAAGKPEHPAQGATSGPRSGSEEGTGVADR